MSQQDTLGTTVNVSSELDYDLNDWPTLRGASGNYFMVAHTPGNMGNLFMRFKVDMVTPPSKDYPGITYFQVMQVNVLAYNFPEEKLKALGDLGSILDVREYKTDSGDKVQATLVQKLYLPLAVEKMSEATAMEVAAEQYKDMLQGYAEALASELECGEDVCSISALILAMKNQMNAKSVLLAPVMYTETQWQEAKGEGSNAQWLLGMAETLKASLKGGGFKGYNLTNKGATPPKFVQLPNPTKEQLDALKEAMASEMTGTGTHSFEFKTDVAPYSPPTPSKEEADGEDDSTSTAPNFDDYKLN